MTTVSLMLMRVVSGWKGWWHAGIGYSDGPFVRLAEHWENAVSAMANASVTLA